MAAATAIAPAAACLPPTELPAPQGVHAAVVAGRAIGAATALRAWGQHPPCRAWEQSDALMRLLGTYQSWRLGFHRGRVPWPRAVPGTGGFYPWSGKLQPASFLQQHVQSDGRSSPCPIGRVYGLSCALSCYKVDWCAWPCLKRAHRQGCKLLFCVSVCTEGMKGYMLHGEVKNLMPTVTTNQLPVCTNQELIAREKNHPFSLFLQMCILRICYHEIRLLVRTNQQSIRGENFPLNLL